MNAGSLVVATPAALQPAGTGQSGAGGARGAPGAAFAQALEAEAAPPRARPEPGAVAAQRGAGGNGPPTGGSGLPPAAGLEAAAAPPSLSPGAPAPPLTAAPEARPARAGPPGPEIALEQPVAQAEVAPADDRERGRQSGDAPGVPGAAPPPVPPADMAPRADAVGAPAERTPAVERGAQALGSARAAPATQPAGEGAVVRAAAESATRAAPPAAASPAAPQTVAPVLRAGSAVAEVPVTAPTGQPAQTLQPARPPQPAQALQTAQTAAGEIAALPMQAPPQAGDAVAQAPPELRMAGPESPGPDPARPAARERLVAAGEAVLAAAESTTDDAEAAPARSAAPGGPLSVAGLSPAVGESGLVGGPRPSTGSVAVLSPAGAAFDTELAGQLRIMVREGQSEARLQLNPPELGRLDIRVATEGDQARISFVVQGADARDALEQALPRLRDMLEQGGLQLARFDVSDQSRQHQERGAEHLVPGAPRPAVADTGDAATPAQRRHGQSAVHALVDYYV